jgi:hypothetical protein
MVITLFAHILEIHFLNEAERLAWLNNFAPLILDDLGRNNENPLLKQFQDILFALLVLLNQQQKLLFYMREQIQLVNHHYDYKSEEVSVENFLLNSVWPFYSGEDSLQKSTAAQNL